MLLITAKISNGMSEMGNNHKSDTNVWLVHFKRFIIIQMQIAVGEVFRTEKDALFSRYIFRVLAGKDV